MITFGEWLPDQPAFANSGVVEARNVVPAAFGYRSLNGFEPYSGAATGTILGLYSVKASDGSGSIFAGDSTKLYEFDTTDSSLTDISKVGGYTLDPSIGISPLSARILAIMLLPLAALVKAYKSFTPAQTQYIATCQPQRQRQTLLLLCVSLSGLQMLTAAQAEFLGGASGLGLTT